MPSREQPMASGSFSCSSPTCTGLLLGAVASVLVIGGIFLAFHNWDYNWLLVTGIGSLLVLIAAAVPFCSRESSRPVHGKRGNGGLHMANSETLPSAPPLSATYSVSQLSLNILPPLYPGCEELPPSPQSSPPGSVPINHIMNINGQSYLLLPIVSPTAQTNTTSSTTEAQNPCYSAALSCLQVQLPSKQESERQNELDPASETSVLPEVPATPSVVPAAQRDLLCESPPAEDTTSPLPTTNVSSPPALQVFDAIPLTTPAAEHRDLGAPTAPCPSESTSTTSTRASRTNSVSERTTVDLQDSSLPDDLLGVSESDVAVSDQLPLIIIDPESSEPVLQNSRDESAQSTNASQAENDTDFLLTVGADASDVDDDDRLVGATPPPSYDEVASERNPSAFEPPFGTL